jgi:hypothetical protein
MSILKLEIRLSEIGPAIEAFKKNRKMALEALSSEMKAAVGSAVNELMKAEIDVLLGDNKKGAKRRFTDKEKGASDERDHSLKFSQLQPHLASA